jgi:hypothetical protein
MCISKLVVSLLSTACLVPAESLSHPEVRDNRSLAGIIGSYYYGDGLGMNCYLDVKPEGRFSFIWRGCLGVYGQNQGGAKVVKDHLILTPEQPNEPGGFGGTATDFIPVQWGERLYLVPKDAAKAFCSLVNEGREPRSNVHGRFYLRRGDWEKKVTGLPIVPKEWESLLQKKPVDRQK